MQKQTQFYIPKNKCQNCYKNIGRYILDCYCIICEQCFSTSPYYEVQDHKICRFCNKPIKGQIIDAKQQSSVNKLSHLFGNINNSLSKTLQVYKFQQSIINRYCMHLEKELEKHKKAIEQISRSSPQIEEFFRNRLNSPGYTQQKHKRTISNTDHSTIKYNPQIQSKRSRSQSQVMFDQHQIKHIHANTRNQSGKAVYKVPNINVNTALRSNKRSARSHISQVYNMKNVEAQQQNQYYNQMNRNNWKEQQVQAGKHRNLEKQYSYWGKKRI